MGKVTNNNELAGRKTYADYIATRPGAERFGTHGLFTTDGVHVNLKKVSEELNAYEGNVWTAIISLRRPDAERLGFNSGTRWRDMLRTQEETLSRELNIPITNLRWFAAFHNESHHPHVHLIAYSVNRNEGYLTPRGVRNLRSSFSKDIFMQDNLAVYEQQTKYRDELRTDSRDLIEGIVKQINAGGYNNPVLEEKLRTLAVRLSKTSGKKVYGYLKADVKTLVNSIVDELAKDERIASLYELWYEQREMVIRTYSETVPERIPLSQNNEFKAVRNAVIREVLNLRVEVKQSVEEPADEWQHVDDDIEISGFSESGEAYSRRRTWWTVRYKEARFFLYGSEGIKPDVERALSLMQAEAETGNGLAMYDLGTMYLYGRGCEADKEKAELCFEKAYRLFTEAEKSAKKPGYLRYRIGKMHAAGHGVAKDYTKAAEWYERSLEEKNPFAAYALGSLYRRGQGVAWDMKKAFELFKMAAEDTDRPNAYAAYELGKMCKTGLGTEVDEAMAEEWYRKAFRGFKTIAQSMADEKLYYRLGQMCMNGIGTEVDYLWARRYLERAVELEHENAMYSLGKLYLMKDNPEYDPGKAVQYLELAAGKENSFAKYKLGCLYFYGTEVERDEPKGMAYLKEAAEQGNIYAAEMLERIRSEWERRTKMGAVNLLFSFSGIIRGRLDERMQLYRSETDRKLKRKIQEKKQAQGLRQ